MELHRGMEAAMARRPADIAAEEWALRLELAAFYRVVSGMGWGELIYNHITLRVPGEQVAFLINPFGLLYDEVTAANLVKIDAQGEKLAPSEYGVNPAGFVIHSAIHAARADAHCVIHTHTRDGMTVACKQGGLLYDNFYSAGLWGRVSYHDFQGITTDEAECANLVDSLGPTNDILILRSHGLLALAPHVPGAFAAMYSLQKACEIQAASHAHDGANVPVPETVLHAWPERSRRMRANQARHGELPFAAAMRRAVGDYVAVAGI